MTGGRIVLRVVAVLAAMLIACALLAPWFAPHDPFAGVLGDRLLPPAWLPGGDARYPFGTDVLGRDILSRNEGARQNARAPEKAKRGVPQGKPGRS